MLLILLTTLLLTYAIPTYRDILTTNILTRLSTICLIFSVVLLIYPHNSHVFFYSINLYNSYYHITPTSVLLSVLLLTLVSIIYPGYLTSTYSYINNYNVKSHLLSIDNTEAYKYILFSLFSLVGSVLILQCNDLLTLYLGIELQSFGVYILACLYPNRSSINASMKYFLLGCLSSCIILLGIAFIYASLGLTRLDSLLSITMYTELDVLSKTGYILIITGLLFKIGAAPLHHWAPDVYNDSSTKTTIYLTSIPKISVLGLLMTLVVEYLPNYNTLSTLHSGNVLLLSATLSLILGSILGLTQSKIKRLLAYSTVSHIGFMLLSLPLCSYISLESYLFYLISYVLTNLNIFLILLTLGYLLKSRRKEDTLREGHDIIFIKELSGIYHKYPLLCLCLCLCLFSMAGIPPLIGFYGKQYVLSALLDEQYYFLSLLAILTSLISAGYYLKIVAILFEHTEATASTNINDVVNVVDTSVPLNVINTQKVEHYINLTNSLAIILISAIITLFSLKPSIILNSCTLISLGLFSQ